MKLSEIIKLNSEIRFRHWSAVSNEPMFFDKYRTLRFENGSYPSPFNASWLDEDYEVICDHPLGHVEIFGAPAHNAQCKKCGQLVSVSIKVTGTIRPPHSTLPSELPSRKNFFNRPDVAEHLRSIIDDNKERHEDGVER